MSTERETRLVARGFALTPSPSPTGRREQEIYFPFSWGRRG
ncbi:hypothetical protein FDUTEX481_10073 [Tolypothrix sp. PCC 7601]|nr:hypothetical protein FDUTEX481_10073 [Tolypothrix sp. PCC 7601]